MAELTLPACAHKRRPFAIEGDGCKKMFHMASRGATTTAALQQLPSAPRIFFGARLNEEGATLILQAQQVARARNADDVEPACAANIVAARPLAHTGLGNKELDRKVRERDAAQQKQQKQQLQHVVCSVQRGGGGEANVRGKARGADPHQCLPMAQNTTGFCCRHAIPIMSSYGWWAEFESFVHYDATLITLGLSVTPVPVAATAPPRPPHMHPCLCMLTAWRACRLMRRPTRRTRPA